MSTLYPTPTPLPPAPDWRALCQELLQPLAEYDGANPYHEHRDLITRTRAALTTPPAVDGDERLRLVTAGVCSGYIAGHDATVEGHYGDPDEVAAEMAPMVLAEVGATPPAATREAGPLPQAVAEISDEELRAIGDTIMGYVADPVDSEEMVAYGRAVWNRALRPVPAKAAPTEEDLYDLAEVFNGDPVPAIRRALELWGGAAVPVPVSERPWERPGWCDAEGQCWRFDPCENGWWSYGAPLDLMGSPRPWTHMAPHWALPVPAAAAGEVE